MVIQVSQALRDPGKVFMMDLQEDWEDIEFNGEVLRFLSPIKVEGSYLYTGAAIALKGSISALIQMRCHRCLEPFRMPLQVEIDEEFVKSQDPEHPDTYLYNGDEINLDEMIADNFFLNIPMRSVCREDCKGLCENCGTNLNVNRCSCDDEKDDDHPFSVLRGLLRDHDKEV